MADLVRLAYYPFLPGVRRSVQELGPAMDDLLEGRLYRGVRRRAVDRVRKTLEDTVLESPEVVGDQAALDELLAHAVTKMILVCLGDRILASRYAAKEAARVRRYLRTDVEDSLREILQVLDVPVDTGRDLWRIHFSDYLKAAPARQEWKLVLQPIEDGWVPVPRRMAEALAEEALRRRIEAELHGELATPPPTDLRAALQSHLDDLGPELAEARKDWNTGDFGPVEERAFPPCIVQLFEQMKSGAMVPHHGRFAFASFLATIGMTGDQILDYMAQLPNFSRDKSEYQIRHIAGELSVEPYTPPGCATMQTQGICPLERRDDICFTIKHPLSYYRRARKRLPAPVEDETTGEGEGRAGGKDPGTGKGEENDGGATQDAKEVEA